ncbi:oxidoreductase [Magnaporthiopsis poae ATCC 64411]|uniref:Oxidoreductase n=1 Tax=Magnaporthiopsis poae (strain ATCC 64411 / 73-15) TaxID=644358 RepID=A0A0C4EBT3_MAGP6|nr:oxidoreductase [Magnaporthiopsis poae ATCC 64411]
MCVKFQNYNPATDMPSLAGKVILITGGTSGTGKEAAAEISRYGRPAQVWIAGRQAEEGSSAVAHIRTWCRTTPPRSIISQPGSRQQTEDAFLASSSSMRRGGSGSYGRWESDYHRNKGSVASAMPSTRGSSLSSDDGDETAALTGTATTKVRFLYMDLASLESVRDAAARFLASVDRLDVLILGAGEIAMPPGATAEGYERHMGVNHLGHALLLKLLMRLLVRTATCDAKGSDVRVISISSMAHRFTTSMGIDFDTLKPGHHRAPSPTSLSPSTASTFHPVAAAATAGHYCYYVGVDNGAEDDGYTTSALLLYGQSKLANILYARELAERCPLFTTNHLWAATANGVESGEYYEPVGVPSRGTAFAQDRVLSWRLWEWTQRELQGYSLPENLGAR